MLGEPAHSPYDLNFAVFGFPVRVTWTHWLMGLIVSFGLVELIDFFYQDASPPRILLMVGCVGAVFLSILVHELGHAFAFRQYGIHSSIVLYHFGGLAIPFSSSVVGRSVSQLQPLQQAWISFAGPLAQLGLAGLVVAIPLATGDLESWLAHIQFVLLNTGMPQRPLGADPMLVAAVDFVLWPSVIWAVLNLVPVWPLDGGQIAQQLIVIFGGTRRHALMLSIGAAGVMVLLGLLGGRLFLAFLFASLLFTNYQMMQSMYRSW